MDVYGNMDALNLQFRNKTEKSTESKRSDSPKNVLIQRHLQSLHHSIQTRGGLQYLLVGDHVLLESLLLCLKYILTS